MTAATLTVKELTYGLLGASCHHPNASIESTDQYKNASDYDRAMLSARQQFEREICETPPAYTLMFVMPIVLLIVIFLLAATMPVFEFDSCSTTPRRDGDEEENITGSLMDECKNLVLSIEIDYIRQIETEPRTVDSCAMRDTNEAIISLTRKIKDLEDAKNDAVVGSTKNPDQGSSRSFFENCLTTTPYEEQKTPFV